MKNYIAPELEIVKFSAEDIITTSGDTGVKLDIGDEGHTIQALNNGSFTYGTFQ